MVVTWPYAHATTGKSKSNKKTQYDAVAVDAVAVNLTGQLRIEHSLTSITRPHGVLRGPFLEAPGNYRAR